MWALYDSLASDGAAKILAVVFHILLGIMFVLGIMFIVMFSLFCCILWSLSTTTTTINHFYRHGSSDGGGIDLEHGGSVRGGGNIDSEETMFEDILEGIRRRRLRMKMVVSKGGGGGGGERESFGEIECVICLEELMAADLCWVLPKCGHRFHSVCARRWFVHKPTCPTCRTHVL